MKTYQIFFTLFFCLGYFSINAQGTMNDLMGVNVDARDPINRVARFSIVRNYHDWSKDTGYPTVNEGDISCPPEFNPRCDITT